MFLTLILIFFLIQHHPWYYVASIVLRFQVQYGASPLLLLIPILPLLVWREQSWRIVLSSLHRLALLQDGLLPGVSLCDCDSYRSLSSKIVLLDSPMYMLPSFTRSTSFLEANPSADVFVKCRWFFTVGEHFCSLIDRGALPSPKSELFWILEKFENLVPPPRTKFEKNLKKSP